MCVVAGKSRPSFPPDRREHEGFDRAKQIRAIGFGFFRPALCFRTPLRKKSRVERRLLIKIKDGGKDQDE